MTNPYDNVPNPMAPREPQQPAPSQYQAVQPPQPERPQLPSQPQQPAQAQPTAPTQQVPKHEAGEWRRATWQEPRPPLEQPRYAQPATHYGPAETPTVSSPTVADATMTNQTVHNPAQSADEPRRRTGLVITAVVVACLLGGAAGFGGSALFNGMQPASQPVAQSTDAEASAEGSGEALAEPGTVADVVAAAGSSVVTIRTASGTSTGSGSGVVIAADGYIVTNNHVVTLDGQAADAQITVQTSDGQLLAAEIVGTDPVVDLAVIRVDADLPALTFASSDDVRVGSTAIVIGAPLGLSNSVTDGVVSAIDRGLRIASSAAPETPDDTQSEQSPFGFWQEDGAQAAAQEISIPVVQTDASINPGNSGGALLNSSGQLMGVNVAIASMGSTAEGTQAGSIGIGFAIESSLVQRVVEEIITTGAATHGLLGATVSDVTDASVGTVGAQLLELTDGGAAVAAGLQAGDVVTAIDGAAVASAVDATAQVRSHAAGATVNVSYVRNGTPAEVQVTLGELS